MPDSRPASRFEHVVGLDLSLTSTGIALTTLGKPCWTATVKSTGTNADSWEQRWRRLGNLVGRITAPVPEGALVLIEAPAYSRTVGHQHDRSGLWWAVYDVLAGSTRTVLPIEAGIIKKYATGNGAAKKDAVVAAVVRRYPQIAVNGNDEADATVLMAIGCRLLGRPLEKSMPKVNLSALDKIRPPADMARPAQEQ